MYYVSIHTWCELDTSHVSIHDIYCNVLIHGLQTRPCIDTWKGRKVCIDTYSDVVMYRYMFPVPWCIDTYRPALSMYRYSELPHIFHIYVSIHRCVNSYVLRHGCVNWYVSIHRCVHVLRYIRRCVTIIHMCFGLKSKFLVISRSEFRFLGCVGTASWMRIQPYSVWVLDRPFCKIAFLGIPLEIL